MMIIYAVPLQFKATPLLGGISLLHYFHYTQQSLMVSEALSHDTFYHGQITEMKIKEES